MPRMTLPPRRVTHSIEVHHVWAPNTPNQMTEVLRVSYSSLPNGEGVGEVVYEPNTARGNRNSDTNHDACILISLALQWGVPLQVMRDAVGHELVSIMGKPHMLPHTMMGAILDRLGEEQGLDPVAIPDNPLDSDV